MGELILSLDDDMTLTQVLHRLWATHNRLQVDGSPGIKPFTVHWRQLSYRFTSQQDFIVWITGFTFALRAMQLGAKL